MQGAVWAAGHAAQVQARFFGGAVALFDVAAYAGGDHVLPSITPAFGAGDDVIDGQIVFVAAVLAGMAVSVQNIASGERDVLVRNLNILAQPNNGRQWKISIQNFAVVLDLFGFFFQEQDYCPTPTGNVERFIRSIEDKHLTHAGLPEQAFRPGCQTS